MDLEYGGGPFSFYVIATDGGSPAQTGTATVTFVIPELTTLVPTTTVVPPQVDSQESSLSVGTNQTSIVLLLVACFCAGLHAFKFVIP